MEEYIKKYFDLITENLQKHLNDESLAAEQKKQIEIRLEIINELRVRISWQFKDNDEKQISRLLWLASMRKSDKPIHLIRKQEKAIHIYDQIKSALPYLKALNSNALNISVIRFVNDLCDKIDLEGQDFRKEFPQNEEIEAVFKPYFEIIRPARGNGNMFNECYNKIEHLYYELKKLND